MARPSQSIGAHAKAKDALQRCLELADGNNSLRGKVQKILTTLTAQAP